ncbi:MAG: DUF4347 domain-containing protein [Bdellovibrionaceae bacterium]|nr:DUF4347 domain-containing protein [Pseudobdellovibrionaceae bacterium]
MPQKIALLYFILFLSACQLVPVYEMHHAQHRSQAQESQKQKHVTSQKVFINAFDKRSDSALFQIAKAEFTSLYKDQPHWHYLEISKIPEIGPALDEMAQKAPIDELVLHAHGSPFRMKIGTKSLHRFNIHKLNFQGSLAPRAKVYLYSCSVGQKSLFNLGTPFVEKLGKYLLKEKGTIYASTKVMFYPTDYFVNDLDLPELRPNLFSKVLSILFVPITLPTLQYITWSPWDTQRIRKIEI